MLLFYFFPNFFFISAILCLTNSLFFLCLSSIDTFSSTFGHLWSNSSLCFKQNNPWQNSHSTGSIFLISSLQKSHFLI